LVAEVVWLPPPLTHPGLMAPASIEGRRPVKEPQTQAPLTTAPITASTIFTR
jgi:hypothetical protein